MSVDTINENNPFMMELTRLRREYDSLKKENEELKIVNGKLRRTVDVLSLSENFFENDKLNKKMKYFTGLSNMSVFNLILEYTNDALNAIRVPRLNNFQKLLLMLMKLRNNYTFTDLGYRFGKKM